MKILIFTDNHFCSTSSIVRARGEKYTLRLENQIQSINWLEQLAIERNCEQVICLGDFFDKPVLNDEELTALKDIRWNNLPHYFIVGNHESSVNGLTYNSTKALQNGNFTIVDKPICGEIDDIAIHMLPYCIENDRKSLKETLSLDLLHKNIILSHNDIKGIQMGPIISKTGYNIDEIDSCCDLFINGHLHNGTKFSDKGINLGNLTGQNFGENSFIYKHNIMILDTETLKYELIENPYAFNFYKIEINSESDLDQLYNIKDNAILSIKCNEKYLITCKGIISDFIKNKIIEYRITTCKDIVEIEVDNVEEFSLDYISKFIEFCKEKIDNTETLEKELTEVCS